MGGPAIWRRRPTSVRSREPETYLRPSTSGAWEGHTPRRSLSPCERI